MKASLAFVFPGQGSQAVSMLADIGAAESVVAETFAEASAALRLFRVGTASVGAPSFAAQC